MMKIYSNFVDPTRFELKFKDLSNIDFSFYFEYRPTMEQLAENEINILALEEPEEYFSNHSWAEKNYDKFSLILDWNERVLKKCSNSQLLIYGESWLDSDPGGYERITKKREKKFEVSHLAGAKKNSYGHFLRHAILNRQDEIEIPKKFYETIEPYKVWQDNVNGKEFILGESMFSIIIENSSHNNYFTEKLTDCILMKTVPIYWGCSNIQEYYDEKGIFIFKSDDEAINIINGLSRETYKNMLPHVEENYKKAFEYKNYVTRIKNQIVELFKYNNLM